MTKIVLPALIGAALSVAFAGSAQAANTRTWISGKGVDQANCGPIASPCRTLQFAHDNTTAGGEIDVLDGAGYGSVNITKSINIINDGAGVAGVLASANGDAISITAGSSDSVVLKGLAIEGANVGNNGITLNSGHSLVVVDCLIQNFVNPSVAGNGIYLKPTAGTSIVTISGTKLFHNASAGVAYFPPSGSTAASVISIDNCIADQNGSGMGFDQRVATSSAVISISNSTASANTTDGISFYEATGGMEGYIDHVTFHANGRYALFVSSTKNSSFFVGRSAMTSNKNGVVFGGSPLTPTIYSYGDNRINGNYAGDIMQGTLTAAAPK